MEFQKLKGLVSFSFPSGTWKRMVGDKAWWPGRLCRDAMERRTMKKTAQGAYGMERFDSCKAQKFKRITIKSRMDLQDASVSKVDEQLYCPFRPFSTCSKWQTRTCFAASVIQGPERGTGRHCHLCADKQSREWTAGATDRSKPRAEHRRVRTLSSLFSLAKRAENALKATFL